MSQRGGFRGRGVRGGPRGSGGGGPPDSSRGRGSPDARRGGAFGGPGGGRGSPDSSRGFGSSDSGRGGRGFRGGGRPPRARAGVFMSGRPARVDDRIANNSDKALVASFRTQGRQDPDEMPLRPDFGTAGTEIKLRANFFPVRIPKDVLLYEYDVAIAPAAGTSTRRVKRRIYELAEQTPAWKRAGLLGQVAHDNSAKLIAAKRLPEPLTIKVPYYDEDEQGPPATGGKEYTLTIKFIQEIDTSCIEKYTGGDPQYRNFDILPVISALNVIMASSPGRTGVVVGRNKYFFRDAAAPFSLGGGLEALKGFYFSVRPAHHQLMVNVNVCTTAFYVEQNLADAMIEFRNATFGARMNAFCKGVRIRTTHLNRRRTIKDVSRFNAKQFKFRADEYGKDVTVEEYFKRKYNIQLRRPEMPLINVGGKDKAILLPPEVCFILPDQPFRGKLSEQHTANMIITACQPPNVNGEAIVNQGLNRLGFQSPGAVLQAFGVGVGQEMAVVPGRILPTPGIKYSQNNSPVIDAKASWNLRGVKFAVGATIPKMAVLVIKDGRQRDEFAGANDPELREVVAGFRQMCVTSGMRVGEEPSYVEAHLPAKDNNDPMRKGAIEKIRQALLTLKPKPGIVMVMLADGDKAVYEGLKHLCDVFLGVATVCVHSSKIKRKSPQYYANVALKFNMKLGGVNHSLSDPSSVRWLNAMLTMIVGMDVTHPGPGSAKGTPSIPAVVASIDNQYAQYPGCLEIQETKKEMITKLKDMMISRLEVFKNRNKGKLPDRVLVYRDGVSEGQFNIVLEEEYPEILQAFRKYDKPRQPYRPKLTIVICGKRHHTRFYPTEESTAAGDGNPRPGTVVDRGVTAVYHFDFFLQAHGGLQGTTRPTHYYVVHDENGFKADQIQGLTHALSYMFSRATKGVSLVSPAYYADIACERGRCYLRKLLHGITGDGTTTSGSTSEEDVMKEAVNLWRNGVHNDIKNTMFYL
ncbi:ribonuclease H-like domain-containing protein [Pisolithus croceorrhizus]|nr:ribonuclease H-like domain-containing protein [Pisolithus croceorrhizus]